MYPASIVKTSLPGIIIAAKHLKRRESSYTECVCSQAIGLFPSNHSSEGETLGPKQVML